MKKLNVFHGLVNYGTQAGLFAAEMRKQGVHSFSVTLPDPYKRIIDYEIKRPPRKCLKKIYAIYNYLLRIKWFCAFNVFHFYFGTSLLPEHKDLRFYRLFKKKVVFHYLGKDVKLYKESLERYEITNMAYSCGTAELALIKDDEIRARLAVETKHADLQIVCNPIYSEFVPGSTLIPLAIDLEDYPFSEMRIGSRIQIMHAPTSRANKGTEFIVAAIDRLESEGYEIDFKLCEGLSHKQLKKEYTACDICIDQVLGGYGTVAIEAMAIGRPVISYLRDIHFNESTFPGGIPIIVANRDDIYDVLKKTIDNKEKLPDIGRAGRHFVETQHDVKVLAKRLIELYRRL